MFQKVFEYAGPHKKGLYAATAVVLVSVLMGVLPFVLAYQVIAPLVMGEVIDASFVILRVVLVLVCLVLQAIFYGWGLNISHKAAYDTLLRLRTALQKRFEKLPLGVIQDKGTGTVKKLFVDDVDSLEVLLAHSMPEGIANLMIPIAVYVAMFFVDWKLALLSLASIPISLIAMKTMYSVGMKKMGPYYMAGQKMNNTIIEYINGMEVVKVFNKDADSYERFRKDVSDYQDKEVLHHINFAMKKNSMTALVGPSGSGKSTIANLLARLWDVKSGSVTIRGVDIRNVPLSELMDQISMVFQRVYLFQDTIYNNISMGKPDATEEEVYEAAKKAHCYDFIMALPDGFQTVVGEGGATLSGGEKQRISIARCILKDAPIVILDEATASVDTDNESYIQEAISELIKGKTLLVIAHRLNTIQNADQILVIDNGQIAQHGTHEELLEQPGIYQDFVNIRKSAAGWSLA